MLKLAAPWAAFVLLGAYLERRALRTREAAWYSLSAVLRLIFRTDTRPGRALVLLGWAALTAWFLPHIVRGPVPVRPIIPTLGGTA